MPPVLLSGRDAKNEQQNFLFSGTSISGISSVVIYSMQQKISCKLLSGHKITRNTYIDIIDSNLGRNIKYKVNAFLTPSPWGLDGLIINVQGDFYRTQVYLGSDLWV